jgi:hypothetical protein
VNLLTQEGVIVTALALLPVIVCRVAVHEVNTAGVWAVLGENI